MKNFIIFHISTGKIIRWGSCVDKDLIFQIQSLNETSLVTKELKASYSNYKITNNKIVEKPPTEISEPVPDEQQPTSITNEQWQDVLTRLVQLESKTHV